MQPPIFKLCEFLPEVFLTRAEVVEYSGWFYISCPVIWKSLFISAFCAYRIIISVETLVKTATHRRCGKVLTNIPTEMDKSSSTKEAISEYRNFDFQFSGSAILSHKNIQWSYVKI